MDEIERRTKARLKKGDAADRVDVCFEAPGGRGVFLPGFILGTEAVVPPGLD